jgi:hypothetical protein
MDRQILAILKPAIKQELLLSDTQLGLLSGLAFTVFFATLGIPLGLVADRTRRTSLVAVALFLFSGMTVLCGLARGFGSLLLARIGVGVGEAGTSPASHAMIADLYPPEERSGAMAVFALGPHLGLLLGLLLGGAGQPPVRVARGVPRGGAARARSGGCDLPDGGGAHAVRRPTARHPGRRRGRCSGPHARCGRTRRSGTSWSGAPWRAPSPSA